MTLVIRADEAISSRQAISVRSDYLDKSNRLLFERRLQDLLA